MRVGVGPTEDAERWSRQADPYQERETLIDLMLLRGITSKDGRDTAMGVVGGATATRLRAARAELELIVRTQEEATWSSCSGWVGTRMCVVSESILRLVGWLVGWLVKQEDFDDLRARALEDELDIPDDELRAEQRYVWLVSDDTPCPCGYFVRLILCARALPRSRSLCVRVVCVSDHVKSPDCVTFLAAL
jgi:hypothetical protein